MMYSMTAVFKTLIAYIFFVSSLAPYTKAHAAWGRAEQNYQTNQNAPTTQNFEFIVAYKAYVKRLIQMQSAVIKKKLVCLGFAEQVNFNLDSIDDEELKRTLETFINSYGGSEECQKFLNEDIPAMHQAYSDMKVDLGLHQSSDNEINTKIWRSVQTGYNRDETRFRRNYCHPDTELPPRFRERCDELAGLAEYDLQCEEIQTPLRMDRTSFCLERLISIFDTEPKHIIKKFSIGALDTLMSNKDLPSIEPLSPLTWRESVKATEIFQEKYINNTSSDQDTAAWAAGVERSSNNTSFAEEDRAGSYFAANLYQAQGWYLFSEYPEDSAPRHYANILSRFPVLSFYSPSTRASYLNCHEVERNLEEICRQYISQLGVSVDYNLDINVLKESFGQAYLKVLAVNSSLINSLRASMDSSNILDENLELKQNLRVSDVRGWERLVKMSSALDSFLEKNPNHDGAEEYFVKKLRRRENWRLGLSIVGVIGLGVGCAYISGGLLLVGCLLASGVGANIYFYNMSLDTYEDSIEMFLANPTDIGEHDLSLIKFDSMKQATQALVIDTLMVGVGVSAGKVVRSTRQLVKGILDNSQGIGRRL